jgi:hypothetical protein
MHVASIEALTSTTLRHTGGADHETVAYIAWAESLPVGELDFWIACWRRVGPARPGPRRRRVDAGDVPFSTAPPPTECD